MSRSQQFGWGQAFITYIREEVPLNKIEDAHKIIYNVLTMKENRIKNSKLAGVLDLCRNQILGICNEDEEILPASSVVCVGYFIITLIKLLGLPEVSAVHYDCIPDQFFNNDHVFTGVKFC